MKNLWIVFFLLISCQPLSDIEEETSLVNQIEAKPVSGNELKQLEQNVTKPVVTYTDSIERYLQYQMASNHSENTLIVNNFLFDVEGTDRLHFSLGTYSRGIYSQNLRHLLLRTVIPEAIRNFLMKTQFMGKLPFEGLVVFHDVTGEFTCRVSYQEVETDIAIEGKAFYVKMLHCTNDRQNFRYDIIENFDVNGQSRQRNSRSSVNVSNLDGIILPTGEFISSHMLVNAN